MSNEKITRRDFLKTSGIVSLAGLGAGCPLNDYLTKEDYILEYSLGDKLNEFPVKITYPSVNEEPLPIIAFSHGFGTSPNLYSKTLDCIAREGYFVIAPEHNDYVNLLSNNQIINLENFGRIEDDSRIVFDAIRRIQGYENITVRESFDLLFNGVILYENSNTQIVDTFNNFVGYRHDELFVALNFAKEFDNVNPNIIGLSGHSLGGVPVIEILSESEKSGNDSIKAGLLLSPANNLTSIKSLSKPTRWVTGNLDEFYSNTLKGYKNSIGPCSFVSFDEVAHANFVTPFNRRDKPEESYEERIEKIKGINCASTCFLNYWLKGNARDDIFFDEYENIVLEYYTH